MYLRKPIKLEELQKRGIERDCVQWLIEWGIKELKAQRDAIKAAEAILEERIEEWADKIDGGQPQLVESDAAAD